MSEVIKGATSYQIVDALDPGTFCDKVEEELRMGWLLVGSHSVVVPGPDEYPIWSQTLIRID